MWPLAPAAPRLLPCSRCLIYCLSNCAQSGGCSRLRHSFREAPGPLRRASRPSMPQTVWDTLPPWKDALRGQTQPWHAYNELVLNNCKTKGYCEPRATWSETSTAPSPTPTPYHLGPAQTWQHMPSGKMAASRRANVELRGPHQPEKVMSVCVVLDCCTHQPAKAWLSCLIS